MLRDLYHRLSDLEERVAITEKCTNENRTHSAEVEKSVLDNKKLTDEFQIHFWKLLPDLEHRIWEYDYTSNIVLYELEMSIRKQAGLWKADFNPRVSIVIPAFNAANYLKSAIDSALSQTYKNTEVIVINDGSNDDGETEEIALSYGQRIRYYRKSNGGVSSALNMGIEKMAGDFFAWLSHDDLYMDEHLERHIEHLRAYRPDANIITFSNFNIIDENSNTKYRQTVECGLYCYNYKLSRVKPEYCLLRGEINGGNILIPKRAFELCGGFNEGLRFSQEKEMWARLMKHYRFMNIPYITTSLRQHGDRVTNRSENIYDETRETRLRILDMLGEDVIVRLEGSRFNFFQAMEEYYKRVGEAFLEEEMRRRKGHP
jgi:glycosyltransferase involved in cell wall biosynthesis